MEKYKIVKRDIYEQIMGPSGIVLITDCRDAEELDNLIKAANIGLKRRALAPGHRKGAGGEFLVCPVCETTLWSSDRYCRKCGQEISQGGAHDK